MLVSCKSCWKLSKTLTALWTAIAFLLGYCLAVSKSAILTSCPSTSFYNTIRRSDYPTADGYLDGLEIVSESFEILMPKFYHQDKTLFILDPPYLRTKQEAYGLGEYFGMVQFLKLMKWVRPPYLFFSSTKSEFLSYMDDVKAHEPVMWERLGRGFMSAGIIIF